MHNNVRVFTSFQALEKRESTPAITSSLSAAKVRSLTESDLYLEYEMTLFSVNLHFFYTPAMRIVSFFKILGNEIKITCKKIDRLIRENIFICNRFIPRGSIKIIYFRILWWNHEKLPYVL